MSNVVSLSNRRADDVYRCLGEIVDDSDLAPETATGSYVHNRILEMLSSGEIDTGVLEAAPLTGVTGAEMADALSALYTRYDRDGYPPCKSLAAMFANQLGHPPGSPVFEAATALGVDADVASADRRPADAVARTTIQAMLLAHLFEDGTEVPLARADKATVLMAALGTGFEPGPTANNASPSVYHHMRSFLAHHDLLDDAADRVVRVTEASRPRNITSLAELVSETENTGLLPAISNVPECVARVAHTPRETVMTGMLADARMLAPLTMGPSALRDYGVDASDYDTGPAKAQSNVVQDGFASAAGTMFTGCARTLYARQAAGVYDPLPKYRTQEDNRALIRAVGAVKEVVRVHDAPEADRYDVIWDDGGRLELHANGAALHLDAAGHLTDPVGEDEPDSAPCPAVITPDGRPGWYRQGIRQHGPSAKPAEEMAMKMVSMS